MPLVNKQEDNKVSTSCAQLIMYLVTTTSTYVNMDMYSILGPSNFEIGATYNLVLRAQMNDVAVIGATQTANHFIFNCNAMRFKNSEVAVNKSSGTLQMVTYASFPMFYNTGATCNVKTLNNSCVCSFILEAQMGNMTIQVQSQTNNTIDDATVYPNYLLIFDIYKCA